MNIPFSTIAKTFLFVALLLLQYQNCSSYNDPSPFQVDKNLLNASSSAPSDVRLDMPSGVMDLQPDDSFLAATGECNTGLAAKHYIEIKMTDLNNAPIPVRQDSLCPADTANVPQECFRATQFRCEHGRYNLLIPISCSAFRGQSISQYKIEGRLVTVDANGVEDRNNNAHFDRNFNVTWRFVNGRSADCP